MSVRGLATQAARMAAQVRAAQRIGPADSVCPFDVAEKLGLKPRLITASTLEGMYSPDPVPRVIVGADRPAGRQRFTCGHEIGHHMFGHGFCLDEVDAQPGVSDETEFLANRFSAALLMPKIAVDAAFARRAISASRASAADAFLVAQDLGVGFATLVRHLQFSMRIVTPTAAEQLQRVKLPSIRRALAGFDVPHDLVVVDDAWGARAVDIQVDDVLLIPGSASSNGACLSVEASPNRHIRAVAAGVGSIELVGGRVVRVRVSRRSYSGLARFRFMEDLIDE